MLTQKQRDLLLYIHERMGSGEIAPSFDEMKEALGLKSKSGIHRLISALVERGYLERLPNRARALHVKKLPEHYDPQSNDNRPAPHLTPTLSSIPLLGKIAAGTPIEAIRDDGNFIDIPPDLIGTQGDYYALRVDGDSMIKAGIHDNDIVIIRRCDRVENGQIAVALVDQNEVTLKRYYSDGADIVLQPENDTYVPQRLSADRVTVQGRLASLVRKY